MCVSIHIQSIVVYRIGRSFTGRRRGPTEVQDLPCCSAEARPLKSQKGVPPGAGGGVCPPSEVWAAPSGEQEEVSRRSMDGEEPARPENTW